MVQVDKSLALRKSHENPSIHKIYAEFLGQPGGEVSEHSSKQRERGRGAGGLQCLPQMARLARCCCPYLPPVDGLCVPIAASLLTLIAWCRAFAPATHTHTFASPRPPAPQLSHKLLHTHYTDHSVDTLPSVRELGGSGEVAKRAALTAAGEMRYKRIAMVGDPSAKR